MNIMNLYVYENRSMSNDLSKPLMLENLNVDNVQIHIPKEIDGTDMGTWAWWFVYQNAKREKYSIPMTLEAVTNDEGEEEYISTVGLNHGFTGKHGTVMYAIEALQADGSGAVTHEWHTKTYKLEVVYTLQGNQTEYDESESDIISALISRVNELIQSGAEIAEIAETIENAAETAQEVIDSIPADYSTLSAQVDTNTEDIGGLKADLGNIANLDTSVKTSIVDAINAAQADIDAAKTDLDDVSADVGEGKTAYTQVMQDETEEEQDVETDTECTKDSEIFTESRNGYINSNGIISGGDKTQHKSFSFQTEVDCKIYVTHTKTYYIGIYNTAPYVSGNLVHRTGSTYQNNPTAESPLSVSAGQYIVISMYNDTTLAFGFTLHYITMQSGQVTTPTVIGALKTRTLALETASESMQDDIDDLKTVKMPWEYAIDHVLCIGDSLTFGSPADSSTMPYPISQNYPYYLGRMLGLSGDVTNGGVPNYGAKTYYHSKFSDFTLTDYNTFIIFLGTNSGLTDTLDTEVDPYEDSADFADTNTGCYCKMIREIYDAVPNAIIILVNTWHIAVVQPDTRTTIDKIGTKYGLPVVETYDVMRYGVNPIYHGGVDDVHCSKAGYLALANLIKDKLYEYFSADISRVNKGMS